MSIRSTDRRSYHHPIVRRLLPLLLPLCLAIVATAHGAVPSPQRERVEVIVELETPPLAARGLRSPDAGPHARRALSAVARAQAAFERRLSRAFPEAEILRRYWVVLDGLAIAAPRVAIDELERLPGVRTVYPSVRYHALLDETPSQLGAPAAWLDGLDGEGVRIAIIDDGIDQTHPFFSPDGFTAPPGFPKGDTRFTTSRVIVARAFPPARPRWRYAAVPFDPVYSVHGTHVAGIAAGGPLATGRGTLSGIAPGALLGNYKALTVPTDSGVGLDGNSPEIVAAIEAAVADGMDILNLSIGEPQVAPDRDAVARALDNAAAAGVVAVVAAGNEFETFGGGSIGSPGSTPTAITVAAADDRGALASFSSAGPTTLSLLAKPDLTAPGVAVLSAVPGGGFGELSGTSMATPHVSGAAALLLQAHPDWTPTEIKSALVLTARPAQRGGSSGGEAPATRQGGGLVDVTAALQPLVFAFPQTLGLGLLDVSSGTASAAAQIELADAGGGAGTWDVSIEVSAGVGVTVGAPGRVEVPGLLPVEVVATASAAEGERSGFVVLRRGLTTRRIPLWFRITRPSLGSQPAELLERPGIYAGDLRDGLALVDRYRYPEQAATLPVSLSGPEQVFRVEVPSGTANLGVAVVSQAKGVAVEPRIVIGSDENRLAGVPALPLVTNPYLDRFGAATRSAAALLPQAGTYSLVFDSVSFRRAGPFRFRFWIDDTTPPTVKLLSRVARGGRVTLRVADAGAGVDPRGIRFRLDEGPWRSGTLSSDGSTAILSVAGARPGRHRLVVRVSDRQEAKNDENVAAILPNTRELRATVRVP